VPIDRQKIIEEAQKKGIDMSWLQQAGQAPQVQATGGLERLSPGAAELMEGVRQTQQRSAPYIPFPQGAPTQRRTEMELGAEQWDQDFERGILEADRNYQLQREQLELQRAAQMAGQAGGAGGEAGGAGGTDFFDPLQSPFHEGGAMGEREATASGYYQSLVDEDIAAGVQFDELIRKLQDLVPVMTRDNVNPNEIMRYAVGRYESYLSSLDRPWHPTMDRDIADRDVRFREQRDKVLQQIEEADRGFRPPEGGTPWHQTITPEEKKHMADQMDISVEELDAQIRLDPDQVLARYFDVLYGG